MRIVVSAVTVLAAGAAAATALGIDIDPRGADTGGGSGGDLPPETVKVKRQTLAETQSETGELGYGEAMTLTARDSATVTALPDGGSTIKRGEALCRLDDSPVVLLYGSLPAYRDLAVGSEGVDVEQFEKNLAKLGYEWFTVDQHYSVATAEAVKQWQDDLGVDVTGTVELGQIVYADGQVRVDSQESEIGDPAQPGTELLGYTGLSKLVTVQLEASEQGLAEVGDTVKVVLPNGDRTSGKVTETETVVEGGGEAGDESETKIDVTVSLDDEAALEDLDQATVSVAFTAAEHEDVLSVPVAALLAMDDGGYGVQVVEGDSTRIVPVETGMFAGGRVEISGVDEGTTVGMPS